MSNVLSRFRSISEMEFYKNATELRCALSGFVMQEKYIPKKWRPIFAYPTVNLLNTMMEHIIAANGIADVYMKTHEEIEVIESFFESAPANATPLWYLGESLKLLGTADFAVFAPGWQDYRGCRIEHDAAVAYGIPIAEV